MEFSFSRMMDVWASLSNTCRAAMLVYTSCGRMSSSRKVALNMARTTSASTVTRARRGWRQGSRDRGVGQWGRET
jgi:hypothetical protein